MWTYDTTQHLPPVACQLNNVLDIKIALVTGKCLATKLGGLVVGESL